MTAPGKLHSTPMTPAPLGCARHQCSSHLSGLPTPTARAPEAGVHTAPTRGARLETRRVGRTGVGTGGSHLGPHALGSAGGRACLQGWHRLPLGDVVGLVLLVLRVCGQVWLLQTLETKHNRSDEFPLFLTTENFTGFFLKVTIIYVHI